MSTKRIKATKFAELLGVARQTVYQLCKRGLIPVGPDGLIDQDEAERAILMTERDPTKPGTMAAKVRALRAKRGAAAVNGIAASALAEAQTADMSIDVARKMRENYAALKAKAEYEQLMGTLVERAVVDRELFDLARSAQQALLSLPHRLAPVLVGKDQAALFGLLDSEIRAAIAGVEKAAREKAPA